MLNLLYLALKALMSEMLDDRLVRRIYEMRLMTINGEYAPDAAGMSAQALNVSRHIMTAPLQKVFNITVEQPVLQEMEEALDRHRKRMLDRRIRSLEVLERFL